MSYTLGDYTGSFLGMDVEHFGNTTVTPNNLAGAGYNVQNVPNELAQANHGVSSPIPAISTPSFQL